MAYLQFNRNRDSFQLNNDQNLDVAQSLRGVYRDAQPFPHVVLDDFVSDEFLDAINANFPSRDMSSVQRDHEHTRAKWGYRPDDLGANPCRAFVSLFNSGPMLRFLEALTGIDGLLPDPHFLGGGLHEIGRGGKLDVHTDFNLHKQLRLVRRLNLLLYLNEDWRPEYGGNLELWDSDLRSCVRTVEPVRNRCVIFQTDQRSFHGHPVPLSCPDHVSRRSIAIYYYTSPVDRLEGDDLLSNKTTFVDTA